MSVYNPFENSDSEQIIDFFTLPSVFIKDDGLSSC